MEVEIQLPLKRFPDSSVSSLNRTGCVKGHLATKNSLQYPWVDNWLAIFPLSGRVESCKVLPEVGFSTLGQTSNPNLAWEESDIFKIKDDNDS